MGGHGQTMDGENNGGHQWQEQVITLDNGNVTRIVTGSTQLQGIAEDRPIVQRAIEPTKELDAQRDAGHLSCSRCRKRIQPSEGFVTQGPGRRRGKRTPQRVYCLSCAQARGTVAGP